MAVKAAPMMMPIARSSTLPLSANSLNSFSICDFPPPQAAVPGGMLSPAVAGRKFAKRHARVVNPIFRALEGGL